MSRSRRDLLTGWFSIARDAAAASRRETEKPPRILLRPPGALLPDERFLEACTGCDACMEACPPGAIFKVTDDNRVLPAIEATRQPCVHCPDIPCAAACPEGALIPPDSPERIRIGIARVNPLTCVTFHREVCDRCYRVCPFPDAALMMVGGRPLVGSGSCTGCGLCERACPVRPRAITIIPERHLVPGLRVPKGEVAPG